MTKRCILECRILQISNQTQ